MPTRDRTDLGPEALALLWAARETGLLEHLLTDAGTASEAAAAAGVTDRAARITVRALADLGFLRRVGAEYEPTNRALGLLATRDVRSVGSLPGALDTFDALTALPETMRSGDPPAPPTDPERATRHRLGASAATDAATVRACVTSAVRAAPAAESVLDVRGGAGQFAREVVARGRRATLFASPEEAAVLDPLLAPTDVTLVGGPLDDLPQTDQRGEPFDLALVADCLRTLSPDAARTLLAALAETLPPDGTLVVVDVFREGRGNGETDGRRSAAAATTAVAAERLALGAGDAHDAEPVREWLTAAGFGSVRVDPVPGTDRTAAVGRGPQG
jgi:SAM-dependent methyltransferase